MSVAMTKVLAFTTELGNGVFNLGSDQLKIALTNTTPNTAWYKLSELTQVSYTNLSGATPLNLTTTSWSGSGGTAKLICADLTLTATGAVGPFQYIYIYDDTATDKNLIAYYNYGSAVTLAASDTFLIDFDNSNGVFTIA